MRQRCDLKRLWVRCGWETWGGKVWRCSRPKMGWWLAACPGRNPKRASARPPARLHPQPPSATRCVNTCLSYGRRLTNCCSTHGSLTWCAKACNHGSVIFTVAALFTYCSASSSSSRLLTPIPHSLDATNCDGELLTDLTASRGYLSIPCSIRACSQSLR